MFDAAAQKKITDAVAEAERGTSGEIVVVVAPNSDAYNGARAAVALAVTFFALLAASYVPGVHPTWLALGVLVVFVSIYEAARLPGVITRVVHDAALDAAVMRGARAAFVEHGVHRTRDRAGVLVYLSMLEHRVQVLGDEGVHKLIGDEGWRNYAGRIVAALKAGRPAEVADVVRDMGALLSKSFPRKADDTNELPDEVVMQR